MCKNECLHSPLRAVLLGTIECRPVHLTAMFNQISRHIATGFCASAHTASVGASASASARCQFDASARGSSMCQLLVAVPVRKVHAKHRQITN